ncbi:hypothetical protein GQR60_03095 [Labilibaculum sp. A4]|uniref:hypothetical protein n=1 Tax=Labilibaculum euxinus TaxID=2686357 RepID=UPI000F61AF48|nr:hypothetical protein [Labilibaculum euxinus]MDQ1770463.1 hypothetical protein [Labilibaculum euxinus]MWN75318.1 hypothetical protein [Labilibaculum euxinus]
MKRSILLMILGLAIFSFACQSKKTENQEATLPLGVSKVLVKETFNAGGYTYINGNNDLWLAVGQRPIEVGKAYYYKGALEMKNFHSKELNRDFPVIYFLNTISDTPIENNMPMQASSMKKQKAKRIEVSIEKTKGITSISELFSKKDEFSGKQISVKGKVTKFNQNIMGKNWIHIQDGSDFEGNFDLTITCKDVVSIGQIIEMSGTIALDKDFGAGYTYDVIMEEAKIQNTERK